VNPTGWALVCSPAIELTVCALTCITAFLAFTAAPHRGVVILHPWAKLGGSMEDPTVLYNFK
jgi:hypothetical protein